MLVSDYDQRQYNLMHTTIKEYKEGKLSLLELINNLSGLVNNLEVKDKMWEEEFIRFCNNLEIAFAFILEYKEERLGWIDPLIEDSLIGLSNMLVQFPSTLQ